MLVHDDEVGRQHVEAVVHGHVAPPPCRRLEGRHDMHVPVPLTEILACEHVPGAIEPGLAQLIGQGFKHVDILGVPLHEHGIVCNLCLDEFVVVRPLVASILSVNKEPFHPGMANSAGVAGEVHALWESAHAAQTSLEGLELVLRKLCRLVDEDDIVLLPLIPEHVPLRGAVAEPDVRAVREYKSLLLVVPVREARELQLHRENVILQQLGMCPADDEDVYAGIPVRQHVGLFAHRPGLAAAARTAVSDEAPAGLEKEFLPLIELEHPIRHSRRPPRQSPRGRLFASRSRPGARPRPCSANAPALCS